MTDKPTFILSKGERGRYDGFEIDDLEARYLSAYTGRFEYEGLPEGCPADYIERMMYCIGGVSGKDVAGLGTILVGAAASLFSTYGYPVRWTPAPVYGTPVGGSVSDSLMAESDNPMLYDPIPMRERIRPYLEIMRKAVNALNTNLVGLTNPVLIEASPGLELKGKIIRNNLGAGDVFLPVIDKGATPATVLDMKAVDHTANLLGVMHDMDGEILDMMGIRSSLEKASGISTAEASASEMQIAQMMKQELRRRQDWLDALNPILGTSISVRPGEGWEEKDAPVPGSDEDINTEEDDDNVTG